jgi:hypothetical protein
MDLFIPIQEVEKINISSSSSTNYPSNCPSNCLFNPLHIDYDKDFLILSNLDYIINFTDNLGNYIVPHNIDSDYHVFNITSKIGYTEYIRYRRPTGYVYLFEPLIENEEDRYLNSEDVQNIQIFVQPESFTDITKTASYPDTVIIENKAIERYSFDIDKLEKMLRGVQIKDRTSFLIIQVEEEIGDDSLRTVLSYHDPSRKNFVFLCIPCSLDFGYFIIVVVNSINSGEPDNKIKIGETAKVLKDLSKVRRYPKDYSIYSNVFPYYKFIDWNITHYHSKRQYGSNE